MLKPLRWPRLWLGLWCLAVAIVVVASLVPPPPVPLQRPQRLYGGESAGIMMAALQEPTQRTVSTIDIVPVPLARPAALGGNMAVAAVDDGIIAPIPASRPARLMVASAPGSTGALAAIDNTVPQPRVLMTPKAGEMVTAYAPGNAALKMLIEGNADGPIGTLPLGRYLCELPGDAAGPASRPIDKAWFDVTNGSSYRAATGKGTYLLRGGEVVFTRGPMRGAVSPSMSGITP